MHRSRQYLSCPRPLEPLLQQSHDQLALHRKDALRYIRAMSFRRIQLSFLLLLPCKALP